MRCYMITPGNGIDSLTLIDCPTPEPGPGQLLVALKAVSLNYRDLLIADGLYRGGGASGIVPLSDGAGEVVAIGEGCSRFRSEEHTSELQSLMRISSAVFCLQKKISNTYPNKPRSTDP